MTYTARYMQITSFTKYIGLTTNYTFNLRANFSQVIKFTKTLTVSGIGMNNILFFKRI